MKRVPRVLGPFTAIGRCMRDLKHFASMSQGATPNLTLDAEFQAGRHWAHSFIIFGMTRPGFEPRSPSLRADTQTTRPLELVHDLIAILDNHNIGVDMTVCIMMLVSGFMMQNTLFSNGGY